MRDVLHRIASDTIAVCRVLVCWYHGQDWDCWRDKPRYRYGGKGRLLEVEPLPPTFQNRTCWRCERYEERRKPRPPVLGLQTQTTD